MSRPNLRAILALATILAAAAVLAFATRSSGVGPATATADGPQFVVACTWSHRAADDPIVHPGAPGASHEHDFFGADGTDAYSTAASLLGTESTCQSNRADTAAYWTPTLYSGDEPVEPGRLFAYYRRPDVADLDPTSILPFPVGLAMVAGDMHASAPQPTSIVAWHCGVSPDASVTPPSCAPGAPLGLRVTFPSCWDGTNLDPPDHVSHLAYPHDARCPSDHPVVLPELVVDVSYSFSGDPTGLRLASGSVGTGHADFLDAWDPDALRALVERCLGRGEGCGLPPVRADEPVAPTD